MVEPAAPTLTVAEAAELLYTEAALLDDRHLDEWLALFTEDARYWLPMADEDPSCEPSLVYDDRARLDERVFRLLDTPAYAQMPPSRTQHDVTNVRVLQQHGRDAVVGCNLVVHEVRVGDPSQIGLATPRSLAGRSTYGLRWAPDEGWRIAEKTVRLLARELPQFNLTFII
ncbi:aromatic-ring-hydroxylating dioxygenase subunit beta [Egicoccus sp. AB-alg2]|uniref:aromatic-ring-hydroxylating dioxygenase subunit beta n=1 Tax=Egicoccus sp. AB-alg2 TaxID=3242693 RepID=UPI00359ED593